MPKIISCFHITYQLSLNKRIFYEGVDGLRTFGISAADDTLIYPYIYIADINICSNARVYIFFQLKVAPFL